MLFPVRCITCNKVIAQYESSYTRRVDRGEKPGAVLDSMNIKRYCCRRMFLTYVNVIDDVLQYGILPPDVEYYDMDNFTNTF